MKEKVLSQLRPLVSDKGLNKEELESLAETIAKNLTDQATEEDVKSAVESSLPYVSIMQKVGNRMATSVEKKYEGYVKPQPKKGNGKDEGGDEEGGKVEKPEPLTQEQIDKMIADQVAAALKPYKDNEEATRLNALLRANEKVKGLPITEAFLRGYKIEKEEDVETVAAQIETDFLEQQQKLIDSKRVAAPPAGNEFGASDTDDLIEKMHQMANSSSK